MNAIAAVDRNFGIGLGGSLLFSIPEDMAHFKRMTLGRTVIMGRKTFLSLPGARALPGRENIVLSGNPGFLAEGALTVRSLPELFEAVRGYAEDGLFVIGGASVYAALLPYCKNAFITKVDACAEADSFFPDIDGRPSWRRTEESEPIESGGLRFRLTTYENITPLAPPVR